MTFVKTTFSKWTLSAAVLLMLSALTVPASAQTQAASGVSPSDNGNMLGIGLGNGAVVDEATLEKRKEIEEAYKRTTKSQPTQTTAVNDPWANMRGSEPPKPAAQSAPKTAQKKKPAQ
jgi:hypothetical protein